MQAEWRFERKRKSQKSRDPMQASFFTNASIDDDTHALVREAIQNSLDAKSRLDSLTPVCVRFSLASHPAGSAVMSRYLPADAWSHFNADDNGLKSPPTASDSCRFLVYEDFNTDGLIGDERSDMAERKNSFYHFMRAEGKSGKQEGDRGRHGIGKYVFPYTSGIRTFIVATVRSSDKRCLIAGQAVLKSHHVDGQQFTPDGWWGNYEVGEENDYFQLPVEDQNLFQELKRDFGLARQEDQPGLSIIMPYVQDEVTGLKLTEHVIREYFWPILNGQLVVEVAEDGVEKLIDRKTVHESLKDLLPAEKVEQLSPYINLAVKAFKRDEYSVFELALPVKPAVPKWDKDYLTAELAGKIHEELNNVDGLVCIRCPLYVQRNDSDQFVASHFDIFLSKDIADRSRKPLFVREGITIPEDRVPTVRGYTSMVVIDSGGLATLLGDSENPAHTEWEKNASQFKGKYRWGSKTIDFVRLSVTKFLNLMSQGDDEEDMTILSDIFYLNLPENDEEVPETRKRRKKQVVGPEPEPLIDPPPPPKPRTYRLSKSLDGFSVKGPIDAFDGVRKYKVTVAYDFAGASKARALKLYHKNDFDLKTGKNVGAPVTENMKDVVATGNTVTFSASSNDFNLEINGFDKRRDIIVDVASEAVKNEAV